MKRRDVLAFGLMLFAGASGAQRARPAEYLVTVAPGADEKAIRDVYGRFGIKAIKALPKDVYLVTLAEDPGPAVMDSLRERSPLIQAVQPNYRYRRQAP
jgi:hypothetical protein